MVQIPDPEQRWKVWRWSWRMPTVEIRSKVQIRASQTCRVLSVNSTDHFSKGSLGSGNIPKILFETARCHLQSQSSGLDASGVTHRCAAFCSPSLTRVVPLLCNHVLRISATVLLERQAFYTDGPHPSKVAGFDPHRPYQKSR